MRRNQQLAGITGTAERSCGPVSRHPRAKLLTLNCANLRYLILPGDLVDADYLNLVAQIRNDARFAPGSTSGARRSDPNAWRQHS